MMNSGQNVDVAIIGGGVIGLSIGNAILELNPKFKVLILDKEKRLGKHASGRNSGVLHAGFYYSKDSFKAKFCKDGNKELKNLCKKNDIKIWECGKIVVTNNEEDEVVLKELLSRAKANNVEVEIKSKKVLNHFEPLANTFENFMWSPTTAVADISGVLSVLQSEFESKGGRVILQKRIELRKEFNEIYLKDSAICARWIVNASGVHANTLANSVDVGTEYKVLPFIGTYKQTAHSNLPLKTLVYPVPNLSNPFLGVHFTLTLDGKIKIGPTAIPVLGREQYSINKGWSLSDLREIVESFSSIVFNGNQKFGKILFNEYLKIFSAPLLKQSSKLVPASKNIKSLQRKNPGIRAQLVHIPSGTLEQDFVVRNYLNSTHILNAISPGWTSAIPFGRYIANQVNSLL